MNSLLDQSIPQEEYEVLFVDNNSSDDSVNIVKENFPLVSLLQLDRNYGFCEGNNRAVRSARGKYIVFLNVDTVVHQNWLSELVNSFESDTAIKGCHSNQILPWVDEFKGMDREGVPDNVYYFDLNLFGYVKYYKRPIHSKVIPTLFLSGACTLIDREIINDLEDVFDTIFFMYGEDIDLALRINSLGYKTVAVPASIVYHKNLLGFKGRLNLVTLKKLNRVIQNRFIAFIKNMYWSEFLLFFPFLVSGIPVKMFESRQKWPLKIVIFFLSIPLNLLGLLIALIKFSEYREKRRFILNKRKKAKYWINKEILRTHE